MTKFYCSYWLSQNHSIHWRLKYQANIDMVFLRNQDPSSYFPSGLVLISFSWIRWKNFPKWESDHGMPVFFSALRVTTWVLHKAQHALTLALDCSLTFQHYCLPSPGSRHSASFGSSIMPCFLPHHRLSIHCFPCLGYPSSFFTYWFINSEKMPLLWPVDWVSPSLPSMYALLLLFIELPV